jgi:hypothetical protein
MYLKYTGYDDTHWIQLLHDLVEWCVLINTAIKGNMNSGEFNDQLSDFQLLSKDSAPRSYIRISVYVRARVLPYQLVALVVLQAYNAKVKLPLYLIM